MEALHSETYSLSTHEAIAGVCKPKEWRKPGIVDAIIIVIVEFIIIVTSSYSIPTLSLLIFFPGS